MQKHLPILIGVLASAFLYVGSVSGTFDEYLDSSIDGNDLLKPIQMEYLKVQKEYPNSKVIWSTVDIYDFPFWCLDILEKPDGRKIHCPSKHGKICAWIMPSGELLVGSESFLDRKRIASKVYRLFQFKKVDGLWVLSKPPTKANLVYSYEHKIFGCQ